MKGQKLYATRESIFFIIEEDVTLGMAYIYIYEDGVCTYDYLQDDIGGCQLFALEDWNVPLNSWRQEPFQMALLEFAKGTVSVTYNSAIKTAAGKYVESEQEIRNAPVSLGIKEQFQ